MIYDDDKVKRDIGEHIDGLKSQIKDIENFFCHSSLKMEGELVCGKRPDVVINGYGEMLYNPRLFNDLRDKKISSPADAIAITESHMWQRVAGGAK